MRNACCRRLLVPFNAASSLACRGAACRAKSTIESRSQFAAHKKYCRSPAVSGNGSALSASTRSGSWATPSPLMSRPHHLA
ncbi:hypothetical protein PF003_g31406 [Phytophthora fragariae]|nr:hypothetical protein PF003_g31406 [Phytophthora fragariae]